MYLKNIEFKNFRCFEEMKMEGFRSVNLFVGPNNGGKTAAMEGIYMGCSTGEDVMEILNSNRSNIKKIEDHLRFLFYNGKFEKDAHINMSFAGANKDLILSVDHTNDLKDDRRRSREISGEIYVSRLESSGPIYQYRFGVANQTDLRIDPAQLIFRCRYLTEIFKLDQDRFEKIVIEPEYNKRFVEFIQNFEPQFADIQFMMENRLFAKYQSGHFIPVGNLGEGTVKAMNIMATLLLEKPDMLFIDEIETGLHYSALKDVWKALLLASKENDIQLFITTHSQEAIKYLAEALEESAPEMKEELALFKMGVSLSGKRYNVNYGFEGIEFNMEMKNEIR